MTDDPREDVKLAAAAALIQINDPFAVPFLVDMLKEPALRSTIEDGLVKSGDPCVFAFARRLVASNDPALKKSGLRLLAEASMPCHVSSLTNMFIDKDLKRPAMQALARMRARKDYAVPVAIETLFTGSGDLSKASQLFLQKASGKDFGAEVSKWNEWWTSTIPRRIHLVPFGSVSRELTRKLAAVIQAEFKLPVAMPREGLAIPPGSKWAGGQYNADTFLNALEEYARKNSDALRVVGVTDCDLGLPGRGYFFSPWRAGGPVVVSARRMKASDYAITCSRAATQAVHALGYSLFLPPCDKPDCPLADVFVVDDLDGRKPRACDVCAQRIAHAVNAERGLSAWSPKAVDMFEAMIAWKSGDDAIRRAIYVSEMWRGPGSADTLWRRLMASATDDKVKALITKRLEIAAQ